MTRPFNITTDDIGAYAQEVLARRGINPNDIDTSDYTIADHLTDAYRAKLEDLTPALFRDLKPTSGDVTSWMRRFVTDRAGYPNLLLQGPTGSGKTHNSYAALWGIVLHYASKGHRFTFMKTTHADFNQAMRPTADDRHIDSLAEFQAVDLLLFDDLGAGQLTDWSTDTLHRLIDTRWAEQRPTIITTNLTAAAMRDRLDERIVSRLLHSEQVPLEGVDHRRSQA